ncbi:MAG: NAD(P)/FAD-dependent oxidoreductase [Nitrospinota bacterium]
MDSSIKNKTDKKTIIIGAGPAGLAAAYKLTGAGMKPIILEKDEVVGGISRTVIYKNYYFDIGGHRFFTRISVVNDIWREVLGDDFLHCKRLSRIYYNNKFFHYPLRLTNALFGLGLWSSILIFASYLYARFFPSKEEKTFEQWVSNRFGKRLYRTFFKSYTEKIFAMPCSEIRSEWAAQRIKGLSLNNVFIGKQSNKIKTLIKTFDYPRLGPGMMWNAVANAVLKKGAQINLNTEVEKIQWSKGRIESLEITQNGEKKVIKGTEFISSMPLQELMHKFTPSVPQSALKAADNLKYRDFLIVALIINQSDVFPDNWIYVHDKSVRVARIQNFKNWSPYMVPDQNKTCLGMEYFCFEGDDLWVMPDKELIELGRKELETLSLVKGFEVKDGAVVRMAKAYPIYDLDYQESLQIISRFLNGINNLQVIGRNGMHRYNNQDHSMLTGMLAAENIMGANHNLWKLTADME